MSIIEGIIGPIAKLIDKIIPDPEARDRAKLELLKLEGGQEMEAIKAQMSAILAEAQIAPIPGPAAPGPASSTSCTRCCLWSIPMGLIAAVQPAMAEGIAGA